ncbi:MAG: hypothetical protein A2W52_03155 [Candidatus Taylorbacteria bacterium RIFCSPHIGHO2_02_49_25]|uniref:Uncharacterized protein n=1 Tax=Candidatus Taylorbacteria bacterium RIFCSPHIGHO2_02_49_25 TaxID=1802305 RepID=A0A1G2MGC3_9BACT|nr:MAG: hypothetical protein A2W52_03155 [Candidatus Taylorbacteria bacterium RIFCSPHIGHO2_02_49_25]
MYPLARQSHFGNTDHVPAGTFPSPLNYETLHSARFGANGVKNLLIFRLPPSLPAALCTVSEMVYCTGITL